MKKEKVVKSNFESVSVINPVSKELELSDIYTPIGDQLVVECKIIGETDSGLKIPDHLQERDYIVKVLVVGNEVKSVKKGDLVYCNFPAQALSVPVLKKKNTEQIQIREYQVLGILASDYKVLTALKK